MEKTNISIKEQCYKPLSFMLDEDLQNLITINNCIQILFLDNIDIELQEGKTLQETFNRYLELIVLFDHLFDNELEEMKQFIKNEVNNFFIVQNHVSKDTFKQIKELNKTFTKVYWEDLYNFKQFQIVQDTLKNNAIPFHNNFLGNVLSTKVKFFQDIQYNNEDISLYLVSKQDNTLFLFTIVYFNEEVKKQLLEYYSSNNLIENKIPNYYDYLKSLIEEQS